MSIQWEKVLKLLLTGVVVLVPALFAVHLVQAVSLPVRMLNQERVSPITGDSSAPGVGFTAGLLKVATNQGADPKSLVMGVLYTKGKAMIDWNGARIPLQNGSYTYVGGEIIDMAPGAIGLLKLADGSSVHICPGSRVRLSRGAGGQTSLSLMRGASRFKFRADKAFQVSVNGVMMSSGLPPQAANPGDFVTAEVHAKQKSGCIICGLKSKLKVTTPANDGGTKETTSPAGNILNVSTDKSAQATTLKNLPIPADIMGGMTQAGNASGSGNAYLCRCREIQRYAQDLAAAKTAVAQAEIKAPSELAPAELVADATVQPPEPAPPVAPPEAPPLALAVPGAPDPFDPNVLPPPAAGEAAEPVLFATQPVVPVAGSGGGLSASPS